MTNISKLESKIYLVLDKSNSITAKEYFSTQREMVSLTTDVSIGFGEFLIEIQSLDEYKKHSVSELFKKFVEERLK